MGNAKHDVAAAMLEHGASGDDVMDYLRSKCKTEAALSCAVSRVRVMRIAKLSPPPALEEAMAPFRGEAGVEEFLQLPMSEMVRVQAAHAVDPRWSDEAGHAYYLNLICQR